MSIKSANVFCDDGSYKLSIKMINVQLHLQTDLSYIKEGAFLSGGDGSQILLEAVYDDSGNSEIVAKRSKKQLPLPAFCNNGRSMLIYDNVCTN